MGSWIAEASAAPSTSSSEQPGLPYLKRSLNLQSGRLNWTEVPGATSATLSFRVKAQSAAFVNSFASALEKEKLEYRYDI